jgi:hypothetical protein
MAALTGACLSIDWPPTVESGHGGGGGGSETVDASGIVEAGVDSSFDANGVTGFICSVATQPGFLATCSTWANIPSTSEVLGYMNDCAHDGAPVGTVLPQGSTCPDLNAITGCCQLMGVLHQDCFYTMDSTTAPQSTQAGCVAKGGIWSTAPIPYQ